MTKPVTERDMAQYALLLTAEELATIIEQLKFIKKQLSDQHDSSEIGWAIAHLIITKQNLGEFFLMIFILFLEMITGRCNEGTQTQGLP